MKKHVKNYLQFFESDIGSHLYCEICRAIACDIHHIVPRSQGGGDEVDNCAAVCRRCHDHIHNRPGGKALNEKLKQIHEKKVWKRRALPGSLKKKI